MRIGVILGSVRQGRKGEGVARWVLESASTREATYELIDLAEHELPHLAEPMPPMMGKYIDERTKAWAHLIDGYDAFIIVTAEYNHGIPGVLKNALDHLYAEWVVSQSVSSATALSAAPRDRPVAGAGRGSGHGRCSARRPVAVVVAGVDDTGVAAEGPHVAALASVFDAVEDWTRLLRPNTVAAEQN